MNDLIIFAVAIAALGFGMGWLFSGVRSQAHTCNCGALRLRRGIIADPDEVRDELTLMCPGCGPYRTVHIGESHVQIGDFRCRVGMLTP